MVENPEKLPRAGRDADACGQVPGPAVATEDFEALENPFVATRPVVHAPDAVVAAAVAVDADGDREGEPGEQLGVVGADEREVGGEREAHGVAGVGRRLVGVVAGVVQHLAVEEGLAAHVADDEVRPRR